MQVKYIPILKLLSETNQRWITASAIADQLGVSLRTVKNYVSDLNHSYPEIIQSSSKGYRIDMEIATSALQDTQPSIPQTAKERAAYVINRIIKSGRPLSFFDLCEELFISPSTLRSIFPMIRRQLKKHQLTLHSVSNMLTIDGTERNKRELLSALLYHESNENFINLETIQNAFPEINITIIKNIVLDVLSEYRYFINDYSLSNLLLHIVIAVDRIRNHAIQNYSANEVSYPFLNSHEYEMAQKVVDRLEEKLQIQFPDAEVQEMTILLASRASSLDVQSITLSNLDQFVSRECMDLVNEMISGMASYFYINFGEAEFMIRFALHINNLLIRAHNERFNKNPLGNMMKATCPLIYDHAVWCSGIIRERTGLAIPDDEIGYIALHFGSALEVQKEMASKLSAVIYCPTYYIMDQRLYETLNQRFNAQLMIANVVTEEASLQNLAKPDLIINTVPMNRKTTVPYVQVYPFLREADIEAVRLKIQEIQVAKKKEAFCRYLHQIILPEFFEHGPGFASREEGIHTLCQKFLAQGYVTPEFEQEVLARENLSSTAFDNFAIPHAMKMNSIRTGMLIYICDTPTNWGGASVSLIILLCFNREERFIFQEIFEPLTMILTNSSYLNKLVTLKEYDAFLQYLVDCL